MENGKNNLTLKSSDERLLKDYFNLYAKEGVIKFSDFLMMTLEKGMFSNKNNFYIFKENFKKVVDNDNQINLNKFVYLMELMAAILFPGEQTPILAIVNSYLSERHIVIEERTVKPRSMIWDDHNKRLLETETIQAFIDYEKDLRAAFTCYYDDNFKRRKIF